MRFNHRPTLATWRRVACAAGLLMLPGCLQSNTARDFGELVRVWPPDEDEQSDPTAVPARTARNAAKANGPAMSSLASSSTQAPVAANPVSTSAPAAAPSPAPAGSAVPAPAASSAAMDGAPGDERLTPDQHNLLRTQIEAITQSTQQDATAQSVTAPQTPPATENLTDYVPANRVAPAADAGAATNATPASATASTAADSGGSTASTAATATADKTTNAAAADEQHAASAAAPAATGSEPSSAAQSSEEPAAPSESSSTTNSSSTQPSSGDTAAASASSASDPASGDAGEPATVEWTEHLQQSITALEAKLATPDLDAAERMRLEGTLRLLYVAASDREQAARPIESADPFHQEFWKQTAYGLLELLAPDGPPIASRRAKLALRSLRESIQQLASISSLDVRNLAICKRVESFGRYTEFEPYEFKSGQEVILYVELTNFTAEKVADGYETELQGSYQVLDAQGRRLMDYDLLLDKQVCRSMRTDYFLPYRIYMPDTLEPGSYKLQVTIEDKKGKKFGQTPPVDFEMAAK